ncbi:MAG: ABC transporter ATP-binding protein [Polyangiaceae bacterium]|nr:ABC transporter ATP-binding protein [Polyangiaceae bacterium]
MATGGTGGAHAVETHGLGKVYKGRVRALDAVNLRVPAGSAFGLLGPNGAGKSTLVKILLSIVRPSQGFATLLGRDVELPVSRREVGYLPEGHRFPPYLTGRGVLEYFGQLAGHSGAALAKDIDEKLELVGMREWGTTRVTKFSKGMQQRIGLAQAMLGSPKLVFLDEPTDGVDPVGRQHIRTVIQDLCRKGTTVFLNSHLLLEVEQICDHVAIMHHGRVLQQGTVDEIRDTVRTERGAVEVRFTTGELGADAQAALAELGAVGPHASGVTVTLPSREEIPRAIDALRSRGVAIYGVEPQRANLEDAFIDLIGAQEDQGVGGTRT